MPSKEIFVASLAGFVAGALVVSLFRDGDEEKRELSITKKSTSCDAVNSQEQVVEREQLTRIYSFFGEEQMSVIRKSFVVVVGVGGVGSHAALHLLRSGVGKIRLVDFDQVTLSSLNRHAVATRADVGLPKVLAMQRHFSHILPSTAVEAKVALFSKENAEDLLSGHPDFVLDCIDNIDTKIELLHYCYKAKIKVISSMGSACKADPSLIQLSDISATSEDALAKSVRTRLKKCGIQKGIKVVFSSERSSIKPLPLPNEQNLSDFAALTNFRVRILPVLGAIPAIFGSSMAASVLTELGGMTLKNYTSSSKINYMKIFSDFCNREKKNLSQLVQGDRLDRKKAKYIILQIFEGKSVLSSNTDGLSLCRWHLDKLPTVDNLVLITKSEMDRHLASGHMYNENQLSIVQAKLQQIRQHFMEAEW